MTLLTAPLTYDEQLSVTRFLNALQTGSPAHQFITYASAVQLVKSYPAMYNLLREELQQNPDIIIAGLDNDIEQVIRLPESVINNRNVILKIQPYACSVLDLVGDDLLQDQSFWLQAVLQDPFGYSCVPAKLRTKDFVKSVLQAAQYTEDFNYLELTSLLSKKLLDDEALMCIIIDRNPRCAFYASERLTTKCNW